ncbi:MAG: hypothetical protein L0I76_30970 [Pseudonocardia sp.]|nr:hypothetical protein [Pseudonocardia sp.]
MDTNAGRPVMRAAMLEQGYTDGELHRARRQGRLVSLRPGAYLSSDDDRLGDREARYAATVAAAAARLAGDDGVLSHASAAVLHGLPLWGVPLDRAHLTRGETSGGRRSAHLHVHMAPLAQDEITEVDGIRVTAPARTVVDLARTLPFTQAVSVADAALHADLVDAGGLADALALGGRRRGGPAARRVLTFADGRADGPGESRSRVAMHRAGLTRPVLQHVIRDRAGRWVGQVDFWWPEAGVVGEFDGKIKYGRLLKPGQEPGEVVYAEKLREDAIRAQDGVRTVVRWTWSEIDRFGPVLERLGDAIDPDAARGSLRTARRMS